MGQDQDRFDLLLIRHPLQTAYQSSPAQLQLTQRLVARHPHIRDAGTYARITNVILQSRQRDLRPQHVSKRVRVWSRASARRRAGSSM